MATLSKTDLSIVGNFGSEKFSGVVGIKADVGYCTEPLLLSYINGRLTGQFTAHDGILRSLSDGSKSTVETTTTKQKETLVIKHDATPITLKDGNYNISYFPGHDIYYAAAQYSGRCGSCADLCNYGWVVGASDSDIGKLASKQKMPMTVAQMVAEVMAAKYPVSVGATAVKSASSSTDEPFNDKEKSLFDSYQGLNEVTSGCADDSVKSDSTSEIGQLDLADIEFS
jgi:hypothetical protein